MRFVKDEAVQSWIYRSIFLSGHCNFSSVIGVNGLWHKNPFFPNEIDAGYKEIPDKELVEFLRLSGIGLRQKESSENPVKYVEEIVNVFPLESRASTGKGVITIGYCSFCIKESIKSLGFGYFKADWLYGKKCELHSSDLEILNTSNHKQTLEQLRFVLAGMDKDSHQISEKKPKFLAEQELVSTEYYVMPCTLYEFFNLASKSNGRYFPDFYHLNFFEKNGRKKVLVKREIYYHYLMCNLMNINGFLNFLDERAEVFEYKYGINQLNTLSEKLLKKKGANCSKCSTWANTDYCPIKPIALVPIEKELFFLSSYLKNPCDSAQIFSSI